MESVPVATFNIHHARGSDGVVDLGRIARVIDAFGAEVIALQEVDAGWPRSGKEHQAARLEELTGMSMAFHPTFVRPDGASYGICLATRSPVGTSFELLPSSERWEPRGVIAAIWAGVTFFATHLATTADDRRRQLARMGELVREVHGPVVVLGDLNATRRHLGPLLRSGLDPGPRRLTAPARWPRRQIDHILTGGGVASTDVASVPTTASDHRPLTAQLMFTL